MKLYAKADGYHTKKAVLAATYAGFEVAVLDASGGEIADAATSQSKGRCPVLETEKGCIFSTGAITRYLARLRRDVGLYGDSVIDSGCIDSWCEFSLHELEVPLGAMLFQAAGTAKVPAPALERAKTDVTKALTVLDKHLLQNTYMAGDRITLADICVCCAVAEGFKHVVTPEIRNPLQNLMRWFNTCMMQPEFKQVLGEVTLSGGAASPKKDEVSKKENTKKEGAPKKEPAPKKEVKKEAAPKQEAAAKKEGKKDKKPSAAKEETKAPSKDDAEKERNSKIKKVVKEGGKRGVEIEGAADMGGLTFFCTSVDEPNGDLDLLDMCMEAMNAKSDPTEEERKGGSGHIGKMLFSAGDKQLAVCAYVPKAKKGECDAKEWLQKVLDLHGGEMSPGSTDLYAKGFVLADSDKNKFPLKMKEPSITEAITFLKKKGLFPDKDDDSDEDFVFGDDDFPS